MTLKDTIAHDLNDAMRARDETRKSTLRMLTAALKNAEIDARGKPFGDAEAVTVVQKQVKQRRDSIDAFAQAGRTDLVDKESAEVQWLQAYLPQRLAADEVAAAVRALVAELGARGPGDMGRVMQAAKARLAGQAEMTTVSAAVKQALAGL